MPTWDQFMVPVLRVLTDGQVRRRRELYSLVADAEQLTETRAETTFGWSSQATELNRTSFR